MHISPSSLPVLLMPTIWPGDMSTIGEPDVPWMGLQLSSYRIESCQVHLSSRSVPTKRLIVQYHVCFQ